MLHLLSGKSADIGLCRPPEGETSFMEKLDLRFENCHGIRDLQASFEFSDVDNAVALYAPNGTMKTSFARTFSDHSQGTESSDRMFPNRTTRREISDETSNSVDGDNIVVVLSYDEDLGPTENTSTLLVNAALRKEYEGIQKGLAEARDELAEALKIQAKTKQSVVETVSQVFTQTDDQFFLALGRIKMELESQKEAPFADVPYDIVLNPTIDALLRTSSIQGALADYVTRLNELLDQSSFFNRETFTLYNASNVTKSLGDNGFFAASHSILLKGNDDQETEVSSSDDLQTLIDSEQQLIADDAKLRSKLEAVGKALNKNAATRAFFRYISDHEELLPELVNPDVFAQKVWKSYIKQHEELYVIALERFVASEKRTAEIEEQALKERTQWQRVIDIFNKRFYVPFELVASNHSRVVLGQEPLLKLKFAFNDGDDRRDVDREELLGVLSNGEKKALYILNVLFEVEARKSSGDPTLFVIDDIADSFDYKNKYAIIHYLKEMSEYGNFRLILLTHNFDFFRTLNSRGVVHRKQCFMAQKSKDSVTLDAAYGLVNPFIKDFKDKFHSDPMSRIACIPFVRNILEYTKGTQDPDYLKLTSLLHWKSDTPSITQSELDAIFNSTFSRTATWPTGGEPVIDQVVAQAKLALTADEGINFSNKLVLSIAIRLLAERFMIDEIDDAEFVAGITSVQTPKLLRRYKDSDRATDECVAVLDSMVLMTPENIHFNSFMYEPIIDMADNHLRELFSQVLELSEKD